MQQKLGRLRLMMGLLCVANMLCFSSSLYGQVIVNDIVDAWNLRHARMSASRWRWTEQQFVPKGGITSAVDARNRGMGDEAAKHGLPIRDERISFPVELLVRDDWLKLHAKSLDLMSGESGQVRDYLSSYDGQQSKMVHGSGSSTTSGILFKDPGSTDLRSYRLMPIRLFVSPLLQHGGIIDPSHVRIVPDDGAPTATAGNSAELIHVTEGFNEFWLDKALQFAVVRWQEVVPGRGVVTEAMIEYLPQKDGLVPESWTIVSYRRPGSGLVSTEILAHVDQAEADRSLTAMDFRLDFPPLARVYDEATKTEFVVATDGSRVPVIGDNGYLTAAAIIQRDAAAARNKFMKRVGFGIVVVGSAALLLVVGMRRKSSA